MTTRPSALQQTRDILTAAARDFRRSWLDLAVASFAYKALAFALLTPATAFFLRWLLSRTGSRFVADADIARFFVTTRPGLFALVLGGALLSAITVLETACLSAIALASARGSRLGPGAALAFGARRSQAVARLTAHMVVRVLVGLVPFFLAGGLVYAVLLRGHDINFYLARRPPAFWAAAALLAVILITLAALIVRTILRWAMALPLLLFEGVHPRKALGASAGRTVGSKTFIAIVLGAWAIGALVLTSASTALLDRVGRGLAPSFAGSLPLLVTFVVGLLLVWAALTISVAILQSSFFALVLVHLYLKAGLPAEAQGSGTAAVVGEREASRRVPRLVLGGIVGVAVFGAVGIALLAMVVTRATRPVIVIAHRGASIDAPENTLAAFRLAADERADYVELDVQESSDGEVVVVHDSDLMKIGGAPLKIWETTAAALREVDIGSRVGAQFSSERVPTLAEVLAVCKGRTRLVIELKSYGHNDRLEERVAALVEAAGMEKDCIYMSLDHRMVDAMKRLRPGWTVGVLAAKALGDFTTMKADFLAVEARMANARFVRRAHRAGRPVYVWTVDDPAWMLRALSCGVDGLITNRPALARAVIERREGMSDAQRFGVALLIRLGARTEALESEDALRP